MLNPDLEQPPNYWERFYSSIDPQLKLPSQFAVFTVGELENVDSIIDVGCGTGRDSIFFAQHGFEVVAVDASHAAIDQCSAHANALKLSNVKFVNASVSDAGLVNKVREKCVHSARSILVYARFFLHAINEEDEQAFLLFASAICEGGGLLALEFRTVRDRPHPKSTPPHYRRFIEPAQFLAKASRLGFHSQYYVEGYGFAKYRNDDAYVARCLMRHDPTP